MTTEAVSDRNHSVGAQTRSKHKLTVVVLKEPGDPLKCRVAKFNDIRIPRQDVSIDYKYILRGIHALNDIKPGLALVPLWVTEDWPGWKKLNVPNRVSYRMWS